MGKAPSGTAMYNEDTNELELVRKNEDFVRKIKCQSSLKTETVHGVEIDGYDIFVLAGPNSSPKPNKKYKYSFRTLSTGGNRMI